MTAQGQHPLWLTPDRRAAVAARLAGGDPTAAAIVARARQTVAARAAESVCGERAVAHAVLAFAGEGESHAAAAVDAWRELVDPEGGELGRANAALIGAAIHDACREQLDPGRHAALDRALFTLCRGFRVADVRHGDPHVVTNNHWAVAHAGAAIAAMAIHGCPDGAGGIHDTAEDIAWAAGRTKVFLMHYGDRGLYHEGLGYQLYPASFLLPCLLAARNALGADWLSEFPALRESAPSLYASVAARRQGPRVGVKLSWNDDGSDWCNRNAAILLLAVAPDRQVGALRWMYDRLNGILGDGLFNPDHAGLFFSLLYYPYAVAPCNPNGVLPNHVTDSRQGLCLFRNRWRDADDAIVGAYARVTHVGGHAHDDAGSIRCMALGHDWIVGGGQARGNAEYQSIVTASDSPRAKPYGCGAIIAAEAGAGGGVFGMDLRRPTLGYAERWLAVDFKGSGGSGLAVAILDLIDDHLSRDWHWNLSFGADLDVTLHADGEGFSLAAGDGARAILRFLGPRPAELDIRRMPDSRRTYQSGDTHVYPGGPFVQARFPHAPHLAIYAVMTVARGIPPTPRLEKGLSVRLGPDRWERPYGAAIPAVFDLRRGGTLCRYPGGALES